MNINLSLFGQMITFAIFIWFTMKFVWPPLMRAMEERQKKIAEGLEAGERGRRELELAKHKATEQLRDAKIQAGHFLEEAKHRANRIVEDSKETARQEGERLIEIAKIEIEQEKQKAKDQLLKQVATLAMAGAEKILQHQIDDKTHGKLMDQLIEEI